MEEQKIFENGVSSSKIPRYELIPREALISLARIFEEGVQLKGADRAWNGTRRNYLSMLSREFVVERLAHGIDHASKAIQAITQGNQVDPHDAGAIMFAGAVMACYLSRVETDEAFAMRAQELSKLKAENESRQARAIASPGLPRLSEIEAAAKSLKGDF